MSVSRKLKDTVEILRSSPNQSSTGTVTHAPPVAAEAACAGRLEILKGGRLPGPDGVFHEADAVLYLPAGTNIRPMADGAGGDGDWARVDGVLYRVVTAHDIAGAGRLVRCLVKRFD